VRSLAWQRLITWAPPLFVALLALPFILKQNVYWEWQVPYWMLERQTEHVAAHGTPTFFLHLKAGAFTPVYMFYGGPTISLLAYPSLVFGAWPVYVASTVGAMVAGYAGIWWTARNLGLSPGAATLPALTFATAPYMIAELYGRGAWTEQVGANVAAVALGGVTAKIWQPDVHPRRATAVLMAAGAVLAGTHNLSLMMAALLLPLLVLALLPLAPRARGLAGVARGAARSLASLGLGAGLTAAWLLPNLWFGPKTYIATNEVSEQVRTQQLDLTNAKNLLWPWPRMPEPLRDLNWLYVQSPMVTVAWAAVALGFALWLQRPRPGRLVLTTLALAVVAAGLMLIIIESSWWTHFPRLIRTIQFSLRLIPYFVMAITLAVIVALLSLPAGRARRVLAGLLIFATGAQAGMAVWITRETKAGSNHPEQTQLKREQITPDVEPSLVGGAGFIFPYQFRIVHHPAGAQPAGPPIALALGDPSSSDVGTLGGTARVGDVRGAYFAWSPFVRMDGDAELVGYDDWGQAVIRVDRTDAKGQWTATVRSRCTTCIGALSGRDPWQLFAGKVVSGVSLLIVMGTAGFWLYSRLGRRRLSGPDERAAAL
jgi:hypothetical protein